MRRVREVAGCVALIISLVVGVMPSNALSQIVVTPANPTNNDSLTVAASAWCPGSPAIIHSTSVALSAGQIKITADVECGMLAVPTLYTVTEIVPPRAPGIYVIEFWVTTRPYAIMSTQITVSEAPVAADQSTWGAIKALCR